MTANADPFDLSGGHPALDFVNTLDERPFPEPIENLESYTDLVRFAALTGLVATGQARALRKLAAADHAPVARRARQLREHLYGMLTAVRQRKAVPPRTLQAITAAIREARAARVLTVSRGEAIFWLRLALTARGRGAASCLCAGDRGSAHHRRPQPHPQMRRRGLRGLLHRPQQGPPQALVQHDQLRQSRKAAALARDELDAPGTTDTLAAFCFCAARVIANPS